jgi:hypothetical protein
MTNLIKFDTNIKIVIGSFLELQDECYHQENFFLGEDFFSINKNKLGFICYNSFYSLFRDICSIPLYFLINEEISNAHGRDCFPILLKEIIDEGHYTPKKKHLIDNVDADLQHTYKELSHLLIRNFNESFGSQMLDFQVSSYSAFENWMSRLYNGLCPDHHDEIIEKRKSKIRDILKNISATSPETQLNEAVTSLFSIKGDFISFPDKVNGIYKNIEKSLYRRNINKDKEIILFLGKLRNTVHNNGIHSGSNASIEINNCTHTIENGRPYKSPSWAESLKLTCELILIYTEILKSIPSRTYIINSFIVCEFDATSIEIFKRVCNDFIVENTNEFKDVEFKNTFFEFLETRMGINANTVGNIVSALEARKDTLPEMPDLLHFFSYDFAKI